MPLLLDRGGFGVALDDDQPTQLAAVLAGNLLPGQLALMLAESDLPRFTPALGQEDAPPVLLHRHPRPACPAVPPDRDRRAQVDVPRRQRRPERGPPVKEPRLPGLERALKLAVGRQVDVIRNPLGVIDDANRWFWRWPRDVDVAVTHVCASHDQTRFRSKSAR